MKRALNALPAVMFALLPLSALAASPSPSPSPALSPTLDKILVAPPNGYAALTNTTPPNGRFTAHSWGQTYGVKAAEAERLMTQYGFVDGYNYTWVSQSTRHVLNEFVMAFSGGKGANQWFTYDKGFDTSVPEFQHADTLTGIPQYFGLHESQSSVYGQAYLDGFIFVKGNDVIGVALVSLADDNLNLATVQAKNQYTAAPDATIPQAQWPENSSSQPSAAAVAVNASAGIALPYLLIAGAAAVAICLGAALLLMRTRRAAAAVAAAPVQVVAAPAPGAAAAPVNLPLQMSADGNFWYDGERWVDVNQEAPPFAQRSPDGAFWWDGYNWRPAPIAAPPVGGR